VLPEALYPASCSTSLPSGLWTALSESFRHGLRSVRLAHQRVGSRHRGQGGLGFRVHQSGRCIAQIVDLNFLGLVHEEFGMRVFRKAQGRKMNTGRSSDGWRSWQDARLSHSREIGVARQRSQCPRVERMHHKGLYICQTAERPRHGRRRVVQGVLRLFANSSQSCM